MSTTRRIGPAVTALAWALFLLPAFAGAQDDNTGDRILSLEQFPALPADRIIVEQRPPIHYVPFEMVDLNTGAPIPPDQVIEFPDDGGKTKQIAARDYYRELNAIEAGFNSIGYSLRQDWKSIVIQRSVVDPRATNGLRTIAARTDSSKPFRLRTEAELDAAVREQAPGPDLTAMRPNPGGLRLPTEIEKLEIKSMPAGVGRWESPATRAATAMVPQPKGKPARVKWGDEFPFEIGDPTLFAAGVYARLDAAGTENRMTLDGSAKAGITVFSKPAELARFAAHLQAPKTGDMSGRISLDVFPFGTIYDKTLSGASVKLSQPPVTRGIDVVLANFVVTLGPVPVRVQAGAQGSVGFRYFAGLNPASAVAEFAPVVRSNLYVKAGADYYVAGVGIDTQLTLVNYDLSMYSELRLWMQVPEGGTKPEWGIRNNLDISHKLQMLNGSAAVYAYVYYPVIGIPPWDRKDWRWELFSWDGFTPVDGNLALINEWTSLGVPVL